MTESAWLRNRRDFLKSATSALAWSMLSAGSSVAEERAQGDTVFELRQYTLRAGQRDTLISLFESQFLTPLNEAGCHVRATFRDLDDPDRFVWIRSFTDMPSRKRALEAFYGGPVWRMYKAAANATMVDSDNVLLLRPLEPMRAGAAWKPAGAGTGGIYGVMIHYLNGTKTDEFRVFFKEVVRPRLAALGVVSPFELQTETATNDFPNLPVREREPVFLWIGRWAAVEELDAFLRGWTRQSGWRDSAPPAVLPALMRKPEILRLAPTARSGWA